MYLSTRRTFDESSDGWFSFIASIRLPALQQIRTIDSYLNKYVGEPGSYRVTSWEDVQSVLPMLPEPIQPGDYYLLACDTQREAMSLPHTSLRLLGHDLSDWTRTSALLNCGPWEGELAEFTARLNEYGLLSLEDAMRAQSILPRAWSQDPHSHVIVWALYELTPSPPG